MARRRASYTNVKVGELIGVHHSTVSRYLSGDRFPSTDTKFTIQKIFDWPVLEQITAQLDETYSSEFLDKIKNKFAQATANTDDQPVSVVDA